MLEEQKLERIKQVLFSHPENNIYAVIDGAACTELRFKIYDWEPQSSCLWSGELEPDVEEVAPYMARLDRDSEFTNWLLREGWGNHWNIFIESALEPEAFRRQVRKLQLVRSPEGITLLFRFYDPRVMEMFLPTCNQEQLQEVFANLGVIAFPNLGRDELSLCRFNGLELSVDVIELQNTEV
ncbi:DUF4123 domain-containing protein [Aestuariibacter salexigens]|uniref:DUF4123 domain-containing protein n=1 Tax=Aestuariibacter salexigens TaxID=226010 RepID=UPI000687E03D|nr:DUF4123 domain-containing protein [Aestuariibacter salexigens]